MKKSDLPTTGLGDLPWEIQAAMVGFTFYLPSVSIISPELIGTAQWKCYKNSSDKPAYLYGVTVCPSLYLSLPPEKRTWTMRINYRPVGLHFTLSRVIVGEKGTRHRHHFHHHLNIRIFIISTEESPSPKSSNN